jgi:hypothetical protein
MDKQKKEIIDNFEGAFEFRDINWKFFFFQILQWLLSLMYTHVS